jgi:hypothetical protein
MWRTDRDDCAPFTIRKSAVRRELPLAIDIRCAPNLECRIAAQRIAVQNA